MATRISSAPKTNQKGGRLGTVAVAGSSMFPKYRDGDWLLVRWFGITTRRRALRIGKVVVVEQEARPGIFLIKRVIRVEESENALRRYWVEGDGAESTDSRQWGAITQMEVVGVVLFRLRRAKSSR